jgi:hypothetical protein
MKSTFCSLIIYLFNSFIVSAQCTTLYITEHQSGSPICNLQEGSYIEICGDEVIGCPRNLYVYKKGYQSGSIVYNLTLDQGWTTHYGKLLVNPNTMLLGFEIQGQTAVYGYSTKPMSDERKRELQGKEEEERKQRLQKEEEEKQKLEKRQKELDGAVNNIKVDLVNKPNSINRIFCSVNFTNHGRNFHFDSLNYFEIIHFSSYGLESMTSDEAKTVCNKIGDGWRLPTKKELKLIEVNSGLLDNDYEVFTKQYSGEKITEVKENCIAIRTEKFQRIRVQDTEIEVMNKDIISMNRYIYYSICSADHADHEDNLIELLGDGWRIPTIDELLEMHKLQLTNLDINNGWYCFMNGSGYIRWFNAKNEKIYITMNDYNPGRYKGIEIKRISDNKQDKLIVNIRLVRSIK